ncbi:hypothetical protein GCM10020331_085960 [Ectobacillus funiculus]
MDCCLSRAGDTANITRRTWTIAKKWDSVYGDRMTEVVMIGIDMARAEIEESLDKCLLTDQEMIEDWSTFRDPLPPFTVME